MFGVRTSEKAPFTLLIDSGDIQIRQCQDLLVSETIIEASYADSGSIGFNRLAGYIFGNNTKQQKMAMVTPVLQYSGSLNEQLSQKSQCLNSMA